MATDENGEPVTNGINGHSPVKSKHRETSEERRIRKEKERKARENETEEERRIRKERERRKETDEERRARKEREKAEGKERRKETEEERAIRKEKERKEREERHKNETEEERRARKERERKDGREKRHETEEERAARKEKERREGKERRHETEEERIARKEKERMERKNETEEERRIRKEKEKRDREKRHETEEERASRKERERQERKEKERREKENGSVKREIKDETCELGDDYFDQEEAKLAKRDVKMEEDIKQEEDGDSQENGEEEGDQMEEDGEDQEEEKEEEYKPDVKEEQSDEEIPLSRRKPNKNKKRKMESEESDEEPLSKKKAKAKKQRKKSESDEESFKPQKKKVKVEKPKPAAATKGSPTKKMTKKEKELEEEKKVWKWWEETEQLPEGVKWRFLEHKGPLFAPLYEPLPDHVKFYYDGKAVRLSEETEEVATFYGKMIEHDYTTKEVFNKNFFKDWRKIMNDKEKELIRDLQKCDFTAINEHFKKLSEERKARSKEEKKAEKEKNEQIIEEYGFCSIDGHKERIGNFRTEPPSLFRGRGEHPKQGMVKRRIVPEDVIINCSKDSEIPQPPEGHRWKKVQHDNTVTWLASWTENIQGQIKYIMLNPSSKLKGEKDWQKYEKARKLKDKIDQIREDYMQDLKSKEMRVRQRAVALYFIDRLALRAGNEKDEDQADTVGCCSLRFEHIELHDELDGKEFVVEMDFLGKDSIRYQNAMAVEKKVFKNLKLFMENKKEGDDLFDRLNTTILNQYLNSLMDGLTAKVFRTYNASHTLQIQLDKLTVDDDPIQAKLLSYNRANRAVAVLCNHQRAVPKTHEKSMENLNDKIEAKQDAIKEAQKQLKTAKKSYKNGGSQSEKILVDKKKKALERLLEQLEKLEIQKTDKDENKTIALGTSKLNYLDPRISVAWCKKHDVPIEKVYNKTQREKFRWAIDMAEADYVF